MWKRKVFKRLYSLRCMGFNSVLWCLKMFCNLKGFYRKYVYFYKLGFLLFVDSPAPEDLEVAKLSMHSLQSEADIDSISLERSEQDTSYRCMSGCTVCRIHETKSVGLDCGKICLLF